MWWLNFIYKNRWQRDDILNHNIKFKIRCEFELLLYGLSMFPSSEYSAALLTWGHVKFNHQACSRIFQRTHDKGKCQSVESTLMRGNLYHAGYSRRISEGVLTSGD